MASAESGKMKTLFFEVVAGIIALNNAESGHWEKIRGDKVYFRK